MQKLVLLVVLSAITANGLQYIEEVPVWEDDFKFAIRAEYDAGLTTTYYGPEMRVPGMPLKPEATIATNTGKEGYGVEFYTYMGIHFYISIMDGWEITYSCIFLPFIIMPFAEVVSWNRPWIPGPNDNPVTPTMSVAS